MPMEVKRLAGAPRSRRFFTLTSANTRRRDSQVTASKNRAGTLRLRSGQGLAASPLTAWTPPPTLTGMQARFTPGQETRLSQIASHAGTDTERLVDCRREFVSTSMGEFPDARRRI